MKNLVQNLRSFLKFFALLAILLVVNLFVARLNVHWDMTEANIYSLSDRSLETARNVQKSLTLYFFHTPEAGSGQVDTERIRTLIRQYARTNEAITFKEVDHTRNPELARKHNVRQNNVILIKTGNRTSKLSQYDLMEFAGPRGRNRKFRGESALTTALVKMTRATDRKIYFTSGFGEYTHQSAQSRSVSRWAQSLRDEGYSLKALNLLTDDMPDTRDMIVVLDPNKDYSSGVISRLRNWSQKGGNLLVAASPESAESVNAVLKGYGLAIQSNQIVDPSRRVQSLQSLVNPFVFAPKLQSHPALSSLRDQGLAVQMGRSAALTVSSDTPETLLETSSEAFAKPLEPGEISTSFNPQTDEKGPFTVGAVNSFGKDKGKLFVFGSASLFANSLLSQTPGNKTFAVNLANWTFDREVSLGIRATPSDYNQVTVTAGQSYVLQLISLVIIPLGIICWGGWVWWNRKNR